MFKTFFNKKEIKKIVLRKKYRGSTESSEMQQKFVTWRVFSLDFQNTQKTHNQPLTIFLSSLEEAQQSVC